MPVIEATSSVAFFNQTSRPLPLPSGTVDGDLLLVYHADTVATGTPTGPPDASWTQIVANQNSTTNDTRLNVWWKRAAGEPSSWTWGTSGQGEVIALRISGVVAAGDAVDPPGYDTAVTASLALDDYAVSTAGSLLLCFVLTENTTVGADIVTAVTGMTEVRENLAVNECRDALWSETVAAAGTVSGKTATFAVSDDWGALLVAVRPAAGSTGLDLVADAAAASAGTSGHALTGGLGMVSDTGDATAAATMHALAGGLGMAADAGAATAGVADHALTGALAMTAAAGSAIAGTTTHAFTGGEAGALALVADAAHATAAATDHVLTGGLALLATAGSATAGTTDHVFAGSAPGALALVATAGLATAGTTVAVFGVPIVPTVIVRAPALRHVVTTPPRSFVVTAPPRNEG